MSMYSLQLGTWCVAFQVPSLLDPDRPRLKVGPLLIFHRVLILTFRLCRRLLTSHRSFILIFVFCVLRSFERKTCWLAEWHVASSSVNCVCLLDDMQEFNTKSELVENEKLINVYRILRSSVWPAIRQKRFKYAKEKCCRIDFLFKIILLNCVEYYIQKSSNTYLLRAAESFLRS